MIMGIDGTWRRDCTMLDVSLSGVQLRIKRSIAGLDLKEFFLLLSVGRSCVSALRIGANRRRTHWSALSSACAQAKRQYAESEH